MEERLRLCREFWNDYKTFVDWLNENEPALHKAIAGSQSGIEISKIKVRHFQVNRPNYYVSIDVISVEKGLGVPPPWGQKFKTKILKL